MQQYMSKTYNKAAIIIKHFLALAEIHCLVISALFYFRLSKPMERI
jgi:hypothetical protein